MKRFMRISLLVVLTAAFLAAAALPGLTKQPNLVTPGVNKNGSTHSNNHCASGKFQDCTTSTNSTTTITTTKPTTTITITV